MFGFVKKLVDFARSIGMSVSVSERLGRAERPLWDGRTLYIDLGSSDSETIAHEIAHYILATRSNRDKEKFGLRVDEVSDDFRTKRESEADILGGVILTELGLPWFDRESTLCTDPENVQRMTNLLSDLTHRHVLPLKQAGRYRRKP